MDDIPNAQSILSPEEAEQHSENPKCFQRHPASHEHCRVDLRLTQWGATVLFR